jgi:hypothetical protein
VNDRSIRVTLPFWSQTDTLSRPVGSFSIM